MKLSILLTIILFSTFNTNAQNRLTGRITDASLEPIPASITLPELEKGVEAGFVGEYSVENIPDGTYTIIYSMLGYGTISIKLTFAGNNSIIKDVILYESAVEMEEIIISTPFHKLQRDNVMKVDRVSIDNLKLKGAVTLSDGISTIPGVESVSTGTGIGKPIIRGLSSNRVLTYTQGVRLENQQFGSEHGLGVNEAGIESVEVIKGPASLLYGSDALGGVIYLNPEKFVAPGLIAADVSSTYFSNTLGTATNIGFKTSSEKLKFLARGAYVEHSDYKTGNGLRVTNSRFNEADFKTSLGYQSSNIKSILRYNYNRSNLGIPEEIGVQNTNTALLNPFQEIDNHILSWDNTYYFSNSSLQVKAGYLFNDRREYEDAESLELQLKLNTLNYDIEYNLPELDNFESIVGVQGMYQTNRNYGEEILIPDATTVDFGILGTTHYHLETVDFQAGIRYDTRKIDSKSAGESGSDEFIPALNKTYSSFNAALGSKLNFGEYLIGRLNLASGFRAPNLAELTSNGVHEGTNRYEIGNANLNNEQNFQVDLSIEFSNDHFELFANGFYNKVNDYIYITPTGEQIDDFFVYDYVQDDAYLYGGEFGFHIHPHPMDWLHFESSFETVTGKLTDDSYLPLIPANSLSNTFRIEFDNTQILKKSYFFITLTNVFEQNNVNTFETKSNAYNLLSLGTGSTFDLKSVDCEIGLNATNLTNENYIGHTSRLKDDGIANMGRSINVNVKLML